MRVFVLAAGAAMLFALGGFQGEAKAGAPPGFLHVDAKAGCVFGNAPHHWFKPAGDGLFFGLVFESDDEGAMPVAIELAVTDEGLAKLPPEVRKFYHNHEQEVAMGEVTLPDMPDGKEKDDLLATLAKTHGRMILISEVADVAPIERMHIPTDPQSYIGTFWSYPPAQ